MKPIALVQLISEQTMQNLVSVLAFRPRHLIHLTTPKTASRAAHIVAAAEQAGLSPSFENIRLSQTPSIAETSRAVHRAVSAAHEAGFLPVVNFTGGTKLMSIGAYEAAKAAQSPSFYVDTEHQCFIDGGSSPQTIGSLLENDLSFTPFRDALNVRTIAAANGLENISLGRDWEPYLPLAAFLLDHPADEQATWEAIHGTKGICANGREPRDPAGWITLLDTPISLPTEIGKMAADLQLVACREGCWYLPQESRETLHELKSDSKLGERYFKAIAPLQFSLAFLTGGWWEVVVMDAAQRSGQFHDLQWSISFSRQPGEAQREEDIVGVDGVQIAYFSCKRGGAKARLLSVLDELDNRARSIGGSFTRRFLCVCYPPKKELRQNLEKRAEELSGIRIVTRDDLKNLDVFKK